MAPMASRKSVLREGSKSDSKYCNFRRLRPLAAGLGLGSGASGGGLAAKGRAE
jgi:hypothetical protein